MKLIDVAVPADERLNRLGHPRVRLRSYGQEQPEPYVFRYRRAESLEVTIREGVHEDFPHVLQDVFVGRFGGHAATIGRARPRHTRRLPYRWDADLSLRW